MEGEENPILNMPRPIVDALFKSADVEAENALTRILSLKARVEKIRKLFQFKKLGRRNLENRRIVAVDGSMSTAPSKRIGSSFAIYSAGYMVFEGDKLIDEKYYAGSLSWIEGRTRNFGVLLKLLMAYTERKAALEAYWKYNPDFILLDGPFFYFRGRCRYIRDVRLEVKGFEKGLDLIEDVRDKTLTLIGTGRAVGVIRRSTGRAIDGWIAYRFGEDSCVRTRDKHVLTMLMPEMSLWSYDSLLDDDPYTYTTLYYFYRYLRQKGYTAQELDEKKLDLISQSKKHIEKNLREDLNLKPEKIPKLKRYYVRYSPTTSPFEVEVVEGTDVIGFSELFAGFYNQTTGLPLPTDLIDNMVCLPKGSTTAFTEEVEARLIKNRKLTDKTTISDYFAYLNPQKKEFV